MKYTIAPSYNAAFIVISVRGDVTRQLAARFIEDSHALGERLKINRYLVDATEAVNVESVTEDYEFAYSDMQQIPGVNPHARVAILVRPEDHSHDFIETVSRNAGFNVTIFTDREEAERELMKR